MSLLYHPVIQSRRRRWLLEAEEREDDDDRDEKQKCRVLRDLEQRALDDE